ncbi:hypothetical protein ABVT39_004162, partial [Epinephelus coioides]
MKSTLRGSRSEPQPEPVRRTLTQQNTEERERLMAEEWTEFSCGGVGGLQVCHMSVR